MKEGVEFLAAAPADAEAIAALLREAELPSEDFAAHLAHFIIARNVCGEVIGAIGAEVYAPDALLRSCIVAPAERDSGIGRQLLDALERAAAAWGVARWWVLATTAETYFTRHGFRPCPRSAAP